VSDSEAVLVLDQVTARKGKSVCIDISFSVPAGSVHSLLGEEESGASAVIACVLGERRPISGRVQISGRDAWADRRSLSGWVEAVTSVERVRRSATVEQLSRRRARIHRIWDAQGLHDRLVRLGVPADLAWKDLASTQRTAALFALAVARSPSLVVFHEADFPSSGSAGDAWITDVREVASSGIAVLIATHRPTDVEKITDGVSILRSGRLLHNDRLVVLRRRFRKIRYRNEISPERDEYGNELDDFDAAQVRVRGWGVEAVVTNFEDSLFERFRQIPGVVDAQAVPMSLTEIFEIVARVRRVDAAPAS